MLEILALMLVAAVVGGIAVVAVGILKLMFKLLLLPFTLLAGAIKLAILLPLALVAAVIALPLVLGVGLVLLIPIALVGALIWGAAHLVAA